MRRLSVTLLLLLTLALAASAAPKKDVPLIVSGDTVLIVQSLPCKVTAGAGADFYVWSFADAVKASADEHVLTVTAAPRGKSTISVVAVTIDFTVDNGKVTKKVTKETGSVVLNVGAEPPAPPAPPAPLAAAFQKAYEADTDLDKAKSLSFLQSAYKGMAAQAGSRADKTNAQFVAWMKSVVEAAAVGLRASQVKSLRTAIGAELAIAWGANTAPLSADAAAAELAKISTALAQVK